MLHACLFTLKILTRQAETCIKQMTIVSGTFIFVFNDYRIVPPPLFIESERQGIKQMNTEHRQYDQRSLDTSQSSPPQHFQQVLTSTVMVFSTPTLPTFSFFNCPILPSILPSIFWNYC